MPDPHPARQEHIQGVKTALKAIRKQPISEKFIDSGMTVVTKANLNTPEVQKLVNPTVGK